MKYAMTPINKSTTNKGNAGVGIGPVDGKAVAVEFIRAEGVNSPTVGVKLISGKLVGCIYACDKTISALIGSVPTSTMTVSL